MEANPAFVGTDRVVVLHAPAALDPDVAGVVLPADPEADHSVRLGDSAKDLLVVVFLLVADEVEDILRNLLHRLHKFILMRIAPLHSRHEFVEIDMVRHSHRSISPAQRHRFVLGAMLCRCGAVA